ncbi:hypothetical protein NDU88_002981 [Pleurodeles waltl]|uniref:Uncharacterized protein n=1 Tax=Pleurodeles waltl TaxID=8319 RepID=A0AAV7UB73_PLEWA|nr:hypothetical protein NDU88_002981 [Pleurodeles waltl]
MSRSIEWEALKVVLRGHCINEVVGVWADVHRKIQTLEQYLRALEAESHETHAGLCALADARDRHAQLIAKLRSFDFLAYQAKIHAKGDMSGQHAAFTSYYKALYDPPTIDGTANIWVFLDDLVLPTMDQLARDDLQLPLKGA